MVLFYAELAILVRINTKMHYFETESLKNFWGGGTAPSPGPTPIGEGTPPPQTPLLGACGASPIFANPSVIFFTILTLLRDDLAPLLRWRRHCKLCSENSTEINFAAQK